MGVEAGHHVRRQPRGPDAGDQHADAAAAREAQAVEVLGELTGVPLARPAEGHLGQDGGAAAPLDRVARPAGRDVQAHRGRPHALHPLAEHRHPVGELVDEEGHAERVRGPEPEEREGAKEEGPRRRTRSRVCPGTPSGATGREADDVAGISYFSDFPALRPFASLRLCVPPNSVYSPVRILLANPRGFCAGVRMAIDVIDQVLRQQGPPVFVYHAIVHNKHVVEDFESRGVAFVEDVAEVPRGATVVFSAHGIPPAVRKRAAERDLVVHDATCPLVTKVHNEVIRYAREGYQIVFVGHRDHQEAVGTVGEAPEVVTVVETPEEVDLLEFPADQKLAYVTQTTLSVTDAQRIIGRLRERFPRVRVPAKEDICYATTNRQDAVSAWSAEADVVLVVGSRNSSNSNRLVDRAREVGTAAYLIDDESEIDPAWLAGAGTVLLTAGASAPEAYVDGVIDRLRRDFGAEVEERTLAEESVQFALPRSVRRLKVVA